MYWYHMKSMSCYAGDCGKGVLLCKHADIQLKAAAAKQKDKPNDRCWLVLFLVSTTLTKLIVFMYFLDHEGADGIISSL